MHDFVPHLQLPYFKSKMSMKKDVWSEGEKKVICENRERVPKNPFSVDREFRLLKKLPPS